MESGIHDDAIIVEQEARESDFHDRRQREIQLSADVERASVFKSLEPLLADAVKRMNLPIQGPLRIADFGCSTGSNSISYMNFIMKRILQRYEAGEAGEAAGHAMMPETLAFFIDFPGNDFNNLIQQLPPKVEDGLDHSGEDGEGRDYFAATIGGTFYDRLLPNESLHFAISMHSLHWISQVCCSVELI